jgi:1-acyl-sn-glycerol-3-phosphate acyltransferase
MMVEPTSEQRRLMTWWERVNFRFCDWINRDDRWRKRASNWFLRTFGLAWVWPSIRHLVHVDGLPRLQTLHPPKGLLLVSNHRSFFDMYVISCILYRKVPHLPQRIYFPVRSEFFYTSPLGWLVNGMMSAWSMYPPVLRQPERAEFNRYTMSRVADLLQQKGSVVGFHPEGTRNKTDDPYTLLPAQPGVGQLIISARPTVLPIFVHGMGNRLYRQIKSNFDRTGRKIIICVGEPMDLESFYAQTPRLRVYMDLAKHVREVLTALGQRERTLRAELEAGPVPPASPPDRQVA